MKRYILLLPVIMSHIVLAMESKVRDPFKQRIQQQVAQYDGFPQAKIDMIFVLELTDAISHGYQDRALWLLEQRPHIITQKPGKHTSWLKMALVYAKMHENTPQANAIDSIAIDILSRTIQLAQQGLYTFETSPLLAACTYNRPTIVQWLLTHNYDMHLQGTKDTQSAFEWAFTQNQRDTDYNNLVQQNNAVLLPALQRGIATAPRIINQCAQLVITKSKQLTTRPNYQTVASTHQAVLTTNNGTDDFETYKNNIQRQITLYDSPSMMNMLSTELSSAVLGGSIDRVTWLLDQYPDLITQNPHMPWFDVALTNAKLCTDAGKAAVMDRIAILLLDRVHPLVRQGRYRFSTSPLCAAYTSKRSAVIQHLLANRQVPEYSPQFKGAGDQYSAIEMAVNDANNPCAQQIVTTFNQLNPQHHINPGQQSQQPLPPVIKGPNTPLWQKAILAALAVYICKKCYDWYYQEGQAEDSEDEEGGSHETTNIPA